MESVTFSELADDLMHGREIEFRYQDKEYSITNSGAQWHFCCDTDETGITLCAFLEFELLVKKVRCLTIDGITMEQIFNDHPGEVTVFGVL